jgi:hypothetical protein
MHTKSRYSREKDGGKLVRKGYSFRFLGVTSPLDLPCPQFTPARNNSLSHGKTANQSSCTLLYMDTVSHFELLYILWNTCLISPLRTQREYRRLLVEDLVARMSQTLDQQSLVS